MLESSHYIEFAQVFRQFCVVYGGFSLPRILRDSDHTNVEEIFFWLLLGCLTIFIRLEMSAKQEEFLVKSREFWVINLMWKPLNSVRGCLQTVLDEDIVGHTSIFHESFLVKNLFILTLRISSGGSATE